MSYILDMKIPANMGAKIGNLAYLPSSSVATDDRGFVGLYMHYKAQRANQFLRIMRIILTIFLVLLIGSMEVYCRTEFISIGYMKFVPSEQVVIKTRDIFEIKVKLVHPCRSINKTLDIDENGMKNSTRSIVKAIISECRQDYAGSILKPVGK